MMKRVVCGILFMLVLAFFSTETADAWSYDDFSRYPDEHVGEIVALEGWVYLVYKNDDGLYEITLTIGTSFSFDKLVALQCESAFVPQMGDHVRIRARYLGQDLLGYSQTMGFKGISELELFEGEYLVDFGWGLTENASYAGLQTGSYKGCTMTLQGEIQKAEIYNGLLALGIIDDLGNMFFLGTDIAHLPEMQVGYKVKAVNAKCEGRVIDEKLLGEEYLAAPGFLLQNPVVLSPDGSPVLPEESTAPALISQASIPAEIFASAEDLTSNVAEILSDLVEGCWDYDEMEDYFIFWLEPADGLSSYSVGDETIVPQLIYTDGFLHFVLEVASFNETYRYDSMQRLLFLVDGVRFHMDINDWDAKNTGLISLGTDGFELIKAIITAKDPVKVRIYFDDGVDFVMSDQQIDALQTLWAVYESVGGLMQDSEVFDEHDRANLVTIK